ncbi:MAG: response regulator [Candidatus Binatia bacterium]|nr:response regulator [Candidatus Binatia bacterium]
MAEILIVEDDASARAVLRETLELAGYQVREAGDGEEALRTLGDDVADLAIIDLFMPRKEGLETIREARGKFPELKIIAISGGGNRGQLEYLPIAERFGANRVLAKPFEQSTLLGAVEELLANSSVIH